MLFCAIGTKRFIFAGWKIRQRGVGPDLAMRVRVAGAHQFTAIFENLHVANPGNFCERRILLGPRVNYAAQFTNAHVRNGKIVPRRKAQDAADASIGSRHEQTALIKMQRLALREKRREVVVERVSLRVWRRMLAAGTFISGAQVTVWIVGNGRTRPEFFYFSLPWPLRALRRDEDPFPQQRIEAFVRSGKQLLKIHFADRNVKS